jgi:plasmid stabilization system protein ParE
VKVSFLKPAQAEYQDALEYYENEQVGLGRRFSQEVSRAVSRMIEFPTLYQSFSPNTRRCLIAKFPYGIIYHYDPNSEDILVVAVAHLHRRPDYWTSRVS